MVGVLKQLHASHSSPTLPGGVFTQEHIFQPIYKMMLAIHTAAFCCRAHTVKVLPTLSLLQKSA